MSDPWGMSESSAVERVGPLPRRLADLAALTRRLPLSDDEEFRWPEAEELPEVQHLLADGWHLLEESGWWTCLPAVWPVEHRCWVRDRLPSVAVCLSDEGRWIEPALVAFGEDEDEAPGAEDAREAGLPPPPTGRIWLLRSPWPSVGFEVVLELIRLRCRELGLEEWGSSTVRLLDAARDLLTWDEGRVWKWWRGPSADVARAWQAQGRTGDQVAGLVARGLGPTEMAQLSGPPCGLTEAQAVGWVDAVSAEGGEAVALVRRWRELGVPAQLSDDPPAVLVETTLEEAGRWFAAGFDLDALNVLHGLPLERAVAWRDAGFAPRVAYQLLQADDMLTPDEALAFDAAGIGPKERLRWVEAGFDVAAARAWTDLGILPNEARVWRAEGIEPHQARVLPGQRLPQGVQVGWFGYGSDPASRQYGVTDPPRTRGSIAQTTDM